MIEQKLKIIELFDMYGNLLTNLKRDILNDYYLEDNSLNEIAQNYNISKQAVHDNISKAIEKLEYFENNLHFLEKKNLNIQFITELNEREFISDIACKKIISKLSE